MHSHRTDLRCTVRMDTREISGCTFDGGISSLIYDGNLPDKEHPPHPHSNQVRQQVSMYSRTLWKHCTLATVSLTLLAAVLLIVDIGLGVHYTNLTRNDTEDIGKELAKLQVIYKTTVGAMEGAKKQLESELSRQTPTNWELKHQTKRSKDYEVQLAEAKKDIERMRYNFPLINAGCTHCTPGWILMNSVCYFFYFSNDGGKSWQSARKHCQTHGGDLVVLDSKDKENTTLNFLMKNEQTETRNNFYRRGYWIGLSEFPKERTWKWVDGRALVEGYWGDGEPGRRPDNCGFVNPKANFFEAWFDNECDNKMRWICEKAPISMS
ncbi:C-type lectin domain family 4 member M-like [Sebastes umbrosus]|uniref:C-type lectin domain family 4 member M-like n=1 Tax=Sebastes umbrosus TaxID=72105 RepID=UPI0018A07A28|nr:C-type lectin domain family 4 member M-like [Sebastes umbrosus]